MDNTLLIIDGAAMLTTAYYGNLPNEIKFNKTEPEEKYYDKILHTKTGIYTNGMYSFMTRLEKMLEEQKPSHLAITFDLTRDTFRRKLYPEYKGNRKETPAPLKMQREMLPRMLFDMGINVFASRDYEGDDLIGSIATKFSNDIDVVIYANDHDMTQLVKGRTRMWYTCRSAEKAKQMYYDYDQGRSGIPYESFHLPDGVFVYGRDSVKWDMGVYPEQVPDMKGLGGDSSDNIPGVKGISDKTAGEILSVFGTIENLYQTIEANGGYEGFAPAWKTQYNLRPAALKALTADGAKEKALLSKKLATIITDMPLGFTLDALKLNVNQAEREKWYQYLSFRSLLIA